MKRVLKRFEFYLEIFSNSETLSNSMIFMREDKSLLQNLVFIPGDTIKAIIAAVVAVKYKDSFFLTEK